MTLTQWESTSLFALPGKTTWIKPYFNYVLQVQIPVAAPSLLQQHQYSYPSLLNGTASTNILTSPTFNTYSNNPTTYPYSSQSIVQQPSYPSVTIPTHNIQPSNIVQLNTSPIKSSNNNNDVTVHYLGGYVIRESNHPFSSNENVNLKENNEQIRCIICQKIDFLQKFFDQENKFCSKLCSFQSNENRPAISNEPIRVKKRKISFSKKSFFIVLQNFQNPIPQQPIDESISLPPDHGLPSDPSKWTVRISKFYL